MAFVVGTTLVTQSGHRAGGGLLLAASTLLAGAFVLVDRRAAAPLLPARLLDSPRLRQGAWGSLINTATTSSAITLVALYLQNTLRRSPLDAAAALLPFSVAVICGAGLSTVLLRRHRPQFVVTLGLAGIAGHPRRSSRGRWPPPSLPSARAASPSRAGARPVRSQAKVGRPGPACGGRARLAAARRLPTWTGERYPADHA